MFDPGVSASAGGSVVVRLKEYNAGVELDEDAAEAERVARVALAEP